MKYYLNYKLVLYLFIFYFILYLFQFFHFILLKYFNHFIHVTCFDLLKDCHSELFTIIFIMEYIILSFINNIIEFDFIFINCSNLNHLYFMNYSISDTQYEIVDLKVFNLIFVNFKFIHLIVNYYSLYSKNYYMAIFNAVGP